MSEPRSVGSTKRAPAVSEARRVEPRVSQEMFQRGVGVSRPEIDARRNAALSQAGLE